jgi:hypothetical protein
MRIISCLDSENNSVCEALRERGKIVNSTKGVVIIFISLVLLAAILLTCSQWPDGVVSTKCRPSAHVKKKKKSIKCAFLIC